MTGNVVVSPNIKRTSVRIDPSGNVINPRTKQIMQPVEPEFMPPVTEPVAHAEVPHTPPQSPTVDTIPQVSTVSVMEQIRQAKENLAQLEELKKLKIAEKEAELELLKQ